MCQESFVKKKKMLTKNLKKCFCESWKSRIKEIIQICCDLNEAVFFGGAENDFKESTIFIRYRENQITQNRDSSTQVPQDRTNLNVKKLQIRITSLSSGVNQKQIFKKKDKRKIFEQK